MPRCLSFCQGFTPFLGLEPKKRLAFDPGAKARHTSFSESARCSYAGKMRECDETLDLGMEGRLLIRWVDPGTFGPRKVRFGVK